MVCRISTAPMAGTSVTQRDYSGEFLYEGGVLKRILFDGGYVEGRDTGPVYMFFLRDHLGSVRAVVSETGVVQQRNNYFPYGDLFPTSAADSTGNRYKYTGKESCDETGLYDFSARFLHTRFGRFTTIDPLAEKYPGISPYVYCNCNPVNLVDPDGEHPVVVGALIGGAISGTEAVIKGKSATEVIAATAGGAVDGAISAAGGKIVTKLFTGLLGGGAGDWVEQKLNVAFGNQDNVSYYEVGVSATIGATTNGVTESFGKGVNSIAGDILASPSARKSMETEVKANLKDSGRKSTKRMIQKTVDENVDKSIQTASKVIDLSMSTIGYSVGFYNDILSDDE